MLQPRSRRSSAWLLMLLISMGAEMLPGLGCHAQATTTQPAPASAPLDPAVEQWLDRLQEQSEQTKTFQGNVRYDRNQKLVGDRQRRFGTLVYAVGPPAKFAVHFDRLVVDERVDKQDRWYIFDGQWQVERIDDEKQFIKRQVVAPNAPPDRANPLGIGEGPFVLPVTMKKDRILKCFDVSLVEPAPAELPNTVHLKLVPKPNRRSDYSQIDLWYDRASLLPVRAQALDESENETVIEVSKPRVNEPVEEKVFDTDEPKEAGWHVEVTPWEE